MCSERCGSHRQQRDDDAGDGSAYDIYSASFNEADAEARFVMLMMALETLLPKQERPTAALALIDRFVKEAEEADELEDVDRRSLVGSLRELWRQSVNQAGKQLAQSLGNGRYMEGAPGQGSETATQFFSRSYKVRSDLVHGNSPRPTRDEVGVRGALLAVFVGDVFDVELRDDADPNSDGAQ